MTEQLHTMIANCLPGFAWKFGSCCVSDDAWVCPDFNDPVFGPALKIVFNEKNMKAGSVWDEGFDIDLRPSGDVTMAVTLVVNEAISAMKENGILENYKTAVTRIAPHVQASVGIWALFGGGE